MYVCKVCKLEFNNIGSYMNHCKSHTDMSKEYVCECGFRTNNSQSYSSHRGKCRIAHPNITYDNLKGRHWKCSKPGWSKGLTKDTDERVNRISKSLKSSEASMNHIKRMVENHTLESYKKTSETRKRKFLSGELKPPVGAGRGKYSYIIYNDKRILLRSTYEFIYALYLLYNNIEFEYESVCVPSVTDYKYAKSFRSDFLIGNEIIEIKGYNSSKINHAKIAFESAGYNYSVRYWKDILPCYNYLKDRIDIDNILENIRICHNSKKYYEYKFS